MYTTAAKVRKVIAISEDDISDADLEDLIARATAQVIEDITGEISWEVLDGSGVTYYTSKKLIADRNGDEVIDYKDVDVYSWVLNDNSEYEAVKLEVESVDSTLGIITLAESQSSSAIITANYRYYLCTPDWTLIETATSLLTAYMFSLRDYAFIPDSEAVSGIRMSFRNMPYERLINEYDRLILKIKGSSLALENKREDITLEEIYNKLRGTNDD